MQALKGDAGSPAPGAGLVRQVLRHALPGRSHRPAVCRGPRAFCSPGSVRVPRGLRSGGCRLATQAPARLRTKKHIGKNLNCVPMWEPKAIRRKSQNGRSQVRESSPVVMHGCESWTIKKAER
ncbi:uncharacterized protein ACBT57_005202 isoform 1-T3 [Dama dama]